MRLVEIGGDGHAVAESDGLRLDVDVSLIDGPRTGDHVIVHAGFAIERLDAQEAEARLAMFDRLAQTVSDGVSTDRV